MNLRSLSQQVDHLITERQRTVERLKSLDAKIAKVQWALGGNGQAGGRLARSTVKLGKLTKSAAKRKRMLTAIRSALRDGPKSPQEIKRSAGVSPYLLNAFVQKGELVGRGTGRARTISLS